MIKLEKLFTPIPENREAILQAMDHPDSWERLLSEAENLWNLITSPKNINKFEDHVEKYPYIENHISLAFAFGRNQAELFPRNTCEQIGWGRIDQFLNHAAWLVRHLGKEGSITQEDYPIRAMLESKLGIYPTNINTIRTILGFIYGEDDLDLKIENKMNACRFRVYNELTSLVHKYYQLLAAIKFSDRVGMAAYPFTNHEMIIRLSHIATNDIAEAAKLIKFSKKNNAGSWSKLLEECWEELRYNSGGAELFYKLCKKLENDGVNVYHAIASTITSRKPSFGDYYDEFYTRGELLNEIVLGVSNKDDEAEMNLLKLLLSELNPDEVLKKINEHFNRDQRAGIINKIYQLTRNNRYYAKLSPAKRAEYLKDDLSL